MVTFQFEGQAYPKILIQMSSPHPNADGKSDEVFHHRFLELHKQNSAAAFSLT